MALGHLAPRHHGPIRRLVPFLLREASFHVVAVLQYARLQESGAGVPGGGGPGGQRLAQRSPRDRLLARYRLRV
eukprot:5769778-Pyramimonas_sp.AAC.1